MKKQTAMILSAMILTFATLPAETKTETASLTEHYVNTQKHYSIDYPSNWNKNDVPKLDLVLFAPPKDASTPSHASMNVVAETVGPGIALEQFYTESATNLKSALKDVKVEKSGSANLNGTETKWLQYTHVMQDITFRVLQYFIVNKETVYLLTFSSVADTFDSYKPEFEAIANSFKINP